MLASYLRKRMEELKPWAQRSGLGCYRLYESELPEFPAIIDWYDGAAVLWVYPRPGDDTTKKQNAYRHWALLEVSTGLKLDHKNIYQKQRQPQRGGQYQRGPVRHVTKIINEQGLKFEVNLSDYIDTGIFLDHRILRNRVRQSAAGKRLLNLFAYTGTFTCYALAGGAAQTTTVDLSNTYAEWTRRNFALNGFGISDQHRVYTDDCLTYLRRAARRLERYDIIVCDPPTFSRSKQTNKDFSVVRNYPELIGACLAVLSPNGVLYFSNNARGFTLDHRALIPGLIIKDISQATIPPDFANRQIHGCWELRRTVAIDNK